MNTALLDLQRTVMRILKNDTSLGNMVKGIFDEVKPKQPFPYIVISDFEESNNHTFCKKGREIDFSLHVYSEYKGNKEIYQIADRIIALLDYTGVQVDNLNTVYLRYENGNTTRETSGPGIKRHFISNFSVIVREA